MGMTLAEKSGAPPAGSACRPTKWWSPRIDLAMSHENADLVRKSFQEIGVARVWDPERIVIILDHRVPAESEKTATTTRPSASSCAPRASGISTMSAGAASATRCWPKTGT